MLFRYLPLRERSFAGLFLAHHESTNTIRIQYNYKARHPMMIKILDSPDIAPLFGIRLSPTALAIYNSFTIHKAQSSSM